MVTQQEKYQAIYDIHDAGPNNYDFGVGLTYPNRQKTHTVFFGITRFDGQETSVEVLLTLLKDIGQMADREEWKFEGILWNWSAYAKKEGSTTIKARVEGTYNSRTRDGKLYVLAHEQPKPLVESISWEELIKRFSQNAAHIIDFKFRRNGAVVRTKVNGMSICENLLKVKRLEIYCPLGYDKTKVGGGAHYFDLTDECTPPVVLADGRVIFSGGGIDYTIYQPNTGAYCS